MCKCTLTLQLITIDVVIVMTLTWQLIAIDIDIVMNIVIVNVIKGFELQVLYLLPCFMAK